MRQRTKKKTCKGCGAELTFGPHSYFKKFCTPRCRGQYHDSMRRGHRFIKTFGDRRRARYGDDVLVEMSTSDAAWLAGFWDGEGTVSIKRTHGGMAKKITYCANARVGNTNQELIRRVAKLIGEEHVYVSSSAPLSPKHKVCYNATVRVRAMRSFLETITPFLFGKNRQATLVLRFLDFQDKASVSNPDFVLYEQLYRECAMLNHRGVT